ncbi:MFS transporter [Fodinicola feengrottensis]|uniref:MFS transporter n=1 Tax=Fodinicola feengrottensis TaxID=435914 RepID=A0ABN2HS81_9ACTN
MTTTLTRPAYRESPYVRYVVSQSVSVLGDQVWYVALSWAAVQQSTPAVAGVIVSVSALPRLLLMLFGGPLVDRYGPRRLMIGSDLLRVVVSVAAAGVALWQPTIALLVVVALVFGAVDAVFLPAAGSMQPRLLRTDQLSSGAALRELTQRAALTLGAPLGGILVAVGGLPLASCVNAVTFAVSALAIASVRPRTDAATGTPERYLIALRAGFGYLARHRVLRTSMAVGFIGNLGFVGPMNVGLALLSSDRGWGSAGIGYLLAGFGIGAAASATLLLKVRIRDRIGLWIALAAAGEAAGITAMALAPNLAAAIAASALTGLSSGVFGVLGASLNQALTEDRFRGRVGSVNALASMGVTPLVMVVTGIAVSAYGLVPTFAGGGAIELLAAAICLSVRDLRRATLR